MHVRRRIAFERIAGAALDHADTLVRRWLSDGRREGVEWVAINPAHRPLVRLRDQRCGGRSDFPCELFVQTSTRLRRRKRLLGRLGLILMNEDPFAPVPSRAGARHNFNARPQWVPVLPVPPDLPPPPSTHPMLGKPSAKWIYLDENNALLGYVVRFEGAGGKQFRPLTIWRRAGRTKPE